MGWLPMVINGYDGMIMDSDAYSIYSYPELCITIRAGGSQDGIFTLESHSPLCLSELSWCYVNRIFSCTC
jgi:hypothetical protein